MSHYLCLVAAQILRTELSRMPKTCDMIPTHVKFACDVVWSRSLLKRALVWSTPIALALCFTLSVLLCSISYRSKSLKSAGHWYIEEMPRFTIEYFRAPGFELVWIMDISSVDGLSASDFDGVRRLMPSESKKIKPFISADGRGSYSIVSAGFPFKAFYGVAYQPVKGRLKLSGAVAVLGGNLWAARGILPLLPAWPGLALDLLIYLILSMTIYIAVQVGRASIRIRRGQCWDCGYPVHAISTTRCPECGSLCAGS